MDMSKQVQKVLQQGVDEKLVAGMNVLVMKDGREILYEEAGAYRRDTIFRLYSQSKPVTAAAAMLLFERGSIDLFQTVGEFLPEYNHMQVLDEKGVPRTSVSPLTIHNLLGMTSGLSYPNPSNLSGMGADRVYAEAVERLNGENPMTTREFAGRMAQIPLAYEPGSYWEYGTSADVLGAVIEQVAQMPLAEFMKKELFEPLEMKDTAFYVPEEKQNRLARVYETVYGEKGAELLEYTGNHLAISHEMKTEPAFASGGAGLASTLDDYQHFAQMLLEDGEYCGRRILRPSTVKFMTSGRLMPRQQTGFDGWIGLNGFSYANLMRVCKDPEQSGMLARAGEYGWDGWLGVYFANFPKEKMTILMGTQKKDSGTFSLTRKVRNTILGSDQV